MDVNIPSAVPPEDDTDPFIPRSPEKILQAQLQELVCYLWDNYLQLYDNATEIFFMGVGNAYLGVKLLLMNRGESIHDDTDAPRPPPLFLGLGLGGRRLTL